MKTLANNRDLYDFLGTLRHDLTARGLKEQSELVARAMAHGAGMSTEFLGESRMALQLVLRETGDRLSQQERVDLEEVIQQIDDAFERRV